MSTPRAGTTYVVAVAAIATGGFATGTTTLILVAAVLALPTSVPAAVGFYLAYGLLALIPGANPSSGSGSGACSPHGRCVTTVSGDPAVWFTLVTDFVGVLALTAAALLNVVLVRRWARRRPPVDDDFAGTPHGW